MPLRVMFGTTSGSRRVVVERGCRARPVAFLVATVAYFRSLGITVERVMTGNGSRYLSKAFASSLSSTSRLSLTPRKPTAKPNASSRPR